MMKNHQKASFFFIFDTCGKKIFFKGGGGLIFTEKIHPYYLIPWTVLTWGTLPPLRIMIFCTLENILN